MTLTDEQHPIEKLKVGDRIVGPFGRYEFVVEAIGEHIVGTYTKVPEHGYPLGSECVYPKRDWERCGGFTYAG